MVEVGLDGGDRELVEDVTRWGQRLLELLERGDAELSVLLCDDEVIRRLNREYRHRDTSTDVLSFPQGEDRLLGDVVISVPTAARQAADAHHALTTEVARLLVHGVLHLLGYDHHSAGEAAEMQAEEDRLLDGLGVATSGLVAGQGADYGPLHD